MFVCFLALTLEAGNQGSNQGQKNNRGADGASDNGQNLAEPRNNTDERTLDVFYRYGTLDHVVRVAARIKAFIGDGDDPGFTTGKSVYLYYIDAENDDRFLWEIADIARVKIDFE